VKLVGTEGVGKPKASETKVDLGPIKGRAQWDVYRSSLTHFVKHLRTHPVDTEFAVLVEFLISPEGSGGEAVRAIHCFILDAQRRNAASFLMNSDHGPFQRAQLRAADKTLGARKKLMAAATRALLESLREQLAGYGAQRTGLEKGETGRNGTGYFFGEETAYNRGSHSEMIGRYFAPQGSTLDADRVPRAVP